jgi:hypothetical protein
MTDSEIRKRCVAIYKAFRFRRDVMKDNRDVVMAEFNSELNELKKEIETNQLKLNISVSVVGEREDIQVSEPVLEAA